MTNPGGIERRTFLRTAAWSAPVIAVVAATPLAAASGGTPPDDLVAVLSTYPLSYGPQEVIFTVMNLNPYRTSGQVVFSISALQDTTFSATDYPSGWPSVTQTPIVFGLQGRQMEADEVFTISLDADLRPRRANATVIGISLTCGGTSYTLNEFALDV
jgi:hypothetical protein